MCSGDGEGEGDGEGRGRIQLGRDTVITPFRPEHGVLRLSGACAGSVEEEAIHIVIMAPSDVGF